jgi:hypothetical protein
MIKAIVFHNAELIKTYEFSKSPVMVGRLPQNDIPINDMGISHQHLQISYDRGKKTYFAADLGSPDGIFLDGKKISDTYTQIESGARLVAGKFSILVEFVGVPIVGMEGESHSAHGGDSSHDDNKAAAPSSKDGIFFSKIPADSESGNEVISVKAFLIELNNKIIYKLNKRSMSFGSSHEDDFFVEGGVFASENMATLTVSGDEYLLQSNTVAGKFKVNGRKTGKCVLENKDRIEFGNNVFTFKVKND